MTSVNLQSKRKSRNNSIATSSKKLIPTEDKITNQTDKKVLSTLFKKGSLTRDEMVKATGIARSTLYDSLTRLTLKGKVTKFSEKSTNPGRPKVYFRLTES